jgi:hypothetical protein
MRAVEDTHFAKQDYRHSASFALRDLGSKNLEQSFDVLPYDVRTGWTRIDRFECALMTCASWADGTSGRYHANDVAMM